MKIAITSAMSLLFSTFICVVFVNAMWFNQQIAKVNDYHYSVVNEIESSDFASSVIDKVANDSKYKTTIDCKSVKDDLRIYQITTKATIRMPIFGFKEVYIKESAAR